MKNVGGIDRLLRFFLSVPFLFILFYLDSNWRYIGLYGFVLLINALTQFCFINRLIGINTFAVNSAGKRVKV